MIFGVRRLDAAFLYDGARQFDLLDRYFSDTNPEVASSIQKRRQAAALQNDSRGDNSEWINQSEFRGKRGCVFVSWRADLLGLLSADEQVNAVLVVEGDY
jgi:hypothetical protein